MRRFLGLITLLIGMISFAGFSSTADLTENSIKVVVDNDVGITLSVEQPTNVDVSQALEVPEFQLETPYFIISYSTLIKSDFEITEQEVDFDIFRPPLTDINSYNIFILEEYKSLIILEDFKFT